MTNAVLTEEITVVDLDYHDGGNAYVAYPQAQPGECAPWWDVVTGIQILPQ